jgi:SAM-dependent methyltransferase
MVNIHHHQPAGAVVDEDALALFQRQWELYRKLVDGDYLATAEAYGVLHRVLAEDVGRPFRFLDLGCGDARNAVTALQGTAVAHYHGIDLAMPALALARSSVDALPCPADLDHGDYIEAMRERPEPADVVWIGLSLHHFATADKRTLMSEIRQVLSANGLFVTYEPTYRDGEDLEAYIARYEEVARRQWVTLTPEEQQAVFTHVRTADIPETASTWAALGRDAGFSETEELFRDPANLFRIYRFRP